MLTAILALGAVLATTAQAAPFDRGYGRLDSLAVRLEAESNQLFRELSTDRFRDANMRQAFNEVVQIRRQAELIHRSIDRGTNLHLVHRNVETLQSLVHHVEEHLAHIPHYDRHVHQIDALIHAMDDCIHDIAEASSNRRPYPIHTQPGVPYGTRLGGQGFSIQFGR
ncbi:MAG TPA: hypothetical protein VL096_00615 [Pirellulaceae bacterium]|nr:hypothetical protein [Pirellulaceae bacterium]